MRSLIVTAALTLAATASAQSLSAATSLFEQGKWQEAANAAAALNSSEGFALAAEATTAGSALVPDNQKKALFEKAQGYAKQAIAKDKNNAEAYFEMARAQGRLAQFSGILQSLGLAGEMKKNLDTAIKLDPKLPGAYVALGLWNANLVSKGFIAVQASGANKNQIIPNFEKAISLEPEVAVHRIEFANALILQNRKAEAATQLQKAVSIPAETFWEKRDLEAAKATLAKLK